MVYKTLQQGVYGWEVTDCIVELSHAGYESAMSTGTDFRRLTPLLVAEALQKAGTEVYEPINRFELDVPEVVLPQVLQSLTNSEARVDTTLTKQGLSHVEGTLPVRRMFDFERAIPDLTGGEGIFAAEFDGYQKTRGKTPVRDRTDNNPFNKEEYLRRTLSRGQDRSFQCGTSMQLSFVHKKSRPLSGGKRHSSV
jgi:ribosomal protection tetracycline resistance protein